MPGFSPLLHRLDLLPAGGASACRATAICSSHEGLIAATPAQGRRRRSLFHRVGLLLQSALLHKVVHHRRCAPTQGRE
jgi:hypothetical protein